jgi:hypothetical protein
MSLSAHHDRESRLPKAQPNRLRPDQPTGANDRTHGRVGDCGQAPSGISGSTTFFSNASDSCQPR